MSCNCNSCPYVHKTTGLSTAGLLTVTNPNNVGNFDPFCIIVTISPNSVITSAPVALTVTVNGSATPIIDIWGYPVTSDRIRSRCRYKGRYIIVQGDPHVTLTTVPCDPEDILRTAATTTTTTETSNG